MHARRARHDDVAGRASSRPARRGPLRDALRAAVGGGGPGAAAMVLRSCCSCGCGRRSTCRWPRARLLRPVAALARRRRPLLPRRVGRAAERALSRFGDTAANEGVLALADRRGARGRQGDRQRQRALWRVAIFPVDTVKTTLQVGGAGAAHALARKVAAAGPLALFDGCVGAALATLAGHYPWFAANNVLEARVPDWGPRRTHARRALIGFACSAVSDTTSNSIRVVKVYVQTAPEPLSYGAALARVVADRGVWGLLFSGLPAKLLCNGVSSVVFSVIWKTLMDRRRAAPGSPRKRDDGDGGNDDDDPGAGLLSRA
ncbi:mitochondrial carrier protein [Aureococcus anophagefferens]|nr:mitochondrial carrier protein [Aureococcus anophagefferens]